MTALAAHPERVRLEGQRRQSLALTYHRLMLMMLLFAGVTGVIVLRLVYLQLFTDRSGAAQIGNPLLPARGDIVDRNGVAARADHRRLVDRRPSQHIARRPGRARRRARRADARAQRRRISGDPALEQATSLYLSRRAVPELVAAVNALGEPGDRVRPRARAALSADRTGRRTSSAGPTSTAMASPAWSRCSTAG